METSRNLLLPMEAHSSAVVNFFQMVLHVPERPYEHLLGINRLFIIKRGKNAESCQANKQTKIVTYSSTAGNPD